MEFEKYIDNYTIKEKLHRMFWNIFSYIFFKPFNLPIFKKWRILMLKLWGSKIGKGSVVHSSAKIWAPWNLEMGQRTCIGPHTIIYNPGKIILGNKVTISQYSYLCTATHNYESKLHTLYWKEIKINDYAWVAARAFVGPGVTIGEGAIVGATASVYKDVEAWTVVGGNPAQFIKKRILK
ncbi:putative colanic acid biosynthesis acetyltransferase [Phocaeicola sp. HCN-40430]|uniref:putative colanic acid biosynthesis acetyltransferase n=1 Tax=Phocaeicola sp. HCN-40430 TaxID=3134664 RepID=UPI0030C46A7C